MLQLTVYLGFNGQCREAMSFYKECLGGDLQLMTMADSPMGASCPEGKKNDIMHASLTGDGFVLMGSDMTGPGGYNPGNNFSVSLNCSSEEQIHSLFIALSDGGTVFQPVSKQFWGALFGMLTDKFGISWMLHYELGH